MKSYRMYLTSINERYIDELVDTLRKGGTIIYPTDTAYAIGCNSLDNRAIERICRLKGINPAKQSLSIICSDISQASEYANIDNKAFRLLKANLPGPFTFILPATPRLSKAFKGRHEIGIRIPANEIARRLAEALGNPLLTTTVEWDTDEPDDISNPEAIAMHYNGSVDAIIDAGPVEPTPSAIVSLVNDPSSPEILREGPLPLDF